MLTVQETAARLRDFDNVLILTHVRPDGDTVGCAAALCAALRTLGKTAYLLPNPGLTDTTGDLRYSRVYISVLDKSQEKDVLKGLKSAAGFLRRELGASLRLRYTPELQFIADDSIQYGAHILELLHDVEQRDGAPETEE